eukprot:SAG31_NODE_11240_length_1050_cov_2.321767_2_plen_290_part_01
MIARHAIRGSAALALPCFVPIGDEVILSPITDMGDAIAILMQLCVPVFVDVHPATQNIDPEKLEAAISPRTKAIIVTHIYGCAADMDPIMEVAKKHNVMVIEDCAQAHLTEYTDGRLCGTMGDLGCFSFQQSKHLSMGDGGAVIANRQDSQHGRQLALCFDKGWPRQGIAAPVRDGQVVAFGAREHLFLAPNYHMTELQAAVGLAQLERLPGMVAARQRAAADLDALLIPTEGLRKVSALPGTGGGSVFWWTFTLDPLSFSVPISQIHAALSAEGVMSEHGYPGPRPLYV